MQLLLFACCIGTLIAKKARVPESHRFFHSALRCCEVVEGGERTWFQFGLDSSKQLIGAGLEEVKCSIVLFMFKCAEFVLQLLCSIILYYVQVIASVY